MTEYRESEDGEIFLDGWPMGRRVDLGKVHYFTRAMHPISVNDCDWSGATGLHPLAAEKLAELMLRPDAREIAGQLLQAVAELPEARRRAEVGDAREDSND